MKKLLTVFTVLAISGCYSTVPPAQDTYVEPYVAPTVYYTQPATYTTPSVVYVEQSTPSVMYIEETAPAYVFLPNPLIYGRPHHYHHHHFSPAPRPSHHHSGHHFDGGHHNRPAHKNKITHTGATKPHQGNHHHK